MKVLVFTGLYPNNIWPNHGVFIKERMSQFAKLEGCQIKVVAPVPYFPPLKINWRWKFSQIVPLEMRDGIAVYHPRYIIIPKMGMVLHGLIMFLSVLRSVKEIRGKFDFDLIDAHWVYPDGFAAVLLGRYFGKPVAVSARGSDINVYGQLPLIRPLLRYTLSKADSIIAVSKALKDAIVCLGIPTRKISVIPNGVDTRKFRPVAKIDARRQLGFLESGKMILTVGNLTANKGFDLIIKALGDILAKSRNRNIFLIVVGEGRFRVQLERIVSSLNLGAQVIFAGSIPHEKLYLFYSAADVLCLASASEGWPNVLLESIACGTPVIATYAGGIPEIIRSDAIGLLVERNEGQISEAINASLCRSWLSEDLVEYAKSRSWDHTARLVHAAFQAVLNGDQHSSIANILSDDAI